MERNVPEEKRDGNIKTLNKVILFSLALFVLSFAFIGVVFAQDSDGDGIPDDEDNCPLVYNPDQNDLGAFHLS